MSRDLHLRLMRRREIARKLRRAEVSKRAMAAYAQGFLGSFEAAEALRLDDVGLIRAVQVASRQSVNRRQPQTASMAARLQETAWRMTWHLLAFFDRASPIRGARYSGVSAQPKGGLFSRAERNKVVRNEAGPGSVSPEEIEAGQLMSAHEVGQLSRRLADHKDAIRPLHRPRCSCGAIPPCPPERDVRSTTQSQPGSASNGAQSSSQVLGSTHRYRFVLCGNTPVARAPHRLSETSK